MKSTLDLLPVPRQVTWGEGTYTFANDRLVVLDGAQPARLRLSAARLQRWLLENAGIAWQLAGGKILPAERVGMALQIDPQAMPHAQGYRLLIGEQRIEITARDEAGIFYGICTLLQMLVTAERAPVLSLPCLEIIDWPDYPVRGVMLDISRDKVPSMTTLYQLIDLLASWKINQFQLYTEHTFAYQNHPVVWEKASPVTAQEIMELDAYCQEWYIELVPNQNSFGHMHRWFEHARYYPLGELAGVELENWWGKGSFTLCPLDPGSLDLLDGLYGELLPNFSSQMFNVGCDETFDLGLGRSKTACEQLGKGRVYLDFLLKIHRLVQKNGRTMQFWGDIIVQYPELVAELPRDLIALEWGYEADEPRAEDCAKFAAAGIPFYVCPGTSSWNSIAGRTENALGNLLNAAENGLRYGAIGFLNTDWGDNGHWQALPVSYLGFAAGAAYSWCLTTNRGADIARLLSLHAFQDARMAAGQAHSDLGNVYRSAGDNPPNNSLLFNILQAPFSVLRENIARVSIPALEQCLAAIEQAEIQMAGEQMALLDAALVRREFAQAARMLKHACQRALFVHGSGWDRGLLNQDLSEIIADYSPTWLRRNRPGGLVDSINRLEKARQDYLS